MVARLLNDKQIRYLREIAPGRGLEEIQKLINTRFGLQLTTAQIKRAKARYKAYSGRLVPRKIHRLTSPEQDAFMIANSSGKSSVELIKMLQDKFGITFTKEQMKGYKNRKKINTGLTGHFNKGHAPANKGQKMPEHCYEKVAKTMFKRGHMPANQAPLGSEVLKGDGYIWVKIAEPRKWRQKHVLVWEAVNGPKPEGYKIIFADRNRNNFAPDNLILVSNAEHARLCQNHLIFDDPELTRSGVALAKVLTAAHKLKKLRR